MEASLEDEKNKYDTFVLLTAGWDGMPIAYHLHEHNPDIKVLVGQVQDFKELDVDKEPEEPKDKKQRLSQYEGMMKKYPARKLVDALKKLSKAEKDETFIFCDQNNLFVYAEELLKAGFTKGLFPTRQDFEFEKDREGAMKFVEENYSQVNIIPHSKFKTTEEAKEYVESVDYPLVLQSQGDYVSTVCPVDDIDINHTEIINALEKYKKDYEQGEIILKEKLIRPIEITPQIVFYNGQPIFTDIDIETKNIGDGENNGNQVGCGSNIIIKTNFEDLINEIAFPEAVFEMAKERKGIFVWDISLYLTEKGIYFGEFCSNRFGYDALMTEMSMSGGAYEHFKGIIEGINPLKATFGVGIRVFNLNRSVDQAITIADPANTWLYEVKKMKENMVSVGDCWDLGVLTASAETFEEAAEAVYKVLDRFSFKEKYTRTKDDFLRDYPTSIVHRFLVTNEIYYDVPGISEREDENDTFQQKLDSAIAEERKKFESNIKEVNEKYQSEISSIRSEIKNILNEP